MPRGDPGKPLPVVFTKAERDTVGQAAARSNMPVSEWVRHQTLSAAGCQPDTPPPKAYAAGVSLVCTVIPVSVCYVGYQGRWQGI